MHGVPLDHENRKRTGHPLTANGNLVARQASFWQGTHDIHARDSPLVKNDAHSSAHALLRPKR
jgi:hypothetical protein